MLPCILSRLLSPSVFLSLWLAVTPAPALAGSMLLLGAGGVGGGGGGGGVVTLDATGSLLTTAASQTGASYTGITVGAGSNRALIFIVSFDSGCSSGNPTGITAVWDAAGANQSMTLLASSTSPPGITVLFGLRNPTSGNKTVTLAWGGTTCDAYITAISFNGVSQTSDATAFPVAGRTTNLGATALSTVTITSAVNDYVVNASGLASGSTASAESDTLLFASSAGCCNNNFAAQYGVGSASKTMTFTLSSSSGWTTAGIDVAHQ